MRRKMEYFQYTKSGNGYIMRVRGLLEHHGNIFFLILKVPYQNEVLMCAGIWRGHH